MVGEIDEMEHLPRDLKQIYNVSQNLKSRSGYEKANNFADEVQQIINFNSEEPLLQALEITKSEISFMMYSKEQIMDINRFCSSGRTPFTIDKAYNLCKLYVTVTTFKQL